MIVLVHGLRAYGAVEHYVAAIARALGERAALVFPDDPVLAPLTTTGATIFPYPAKLLESAPGLARRLTGLFRRLRPEIIHVTDVFPPALVAARLAGVRRLVVTHHTPELPRRDNPAGRFWWRLGWLARPLVIYTSQADRGRDGRHPSVVVPLGVDIERFASGVPGLTFEGPVIGSIGRLAPQKGHRILLEAAPSVLARHPDARFVIVGDGELRSSLERQAREAGIAERVLFTGSRDDIPDLLASFDLFANPSLYEGLCVAVLEAQAARVPVVATPVGGVRETVVDGETGFLSPPGDSSALAEQISWCLDHPDEARRVAAEAERRVRARFSEHQMVEATLALYDEMR